MCFLCMVLLVMVRDHVVVCVLLWLSGLMAVEGSLVPSVGGYWGRVWFELGACGWLLFCVRFSRFGVLFEGRLAWGVG